MPEEQKAEIIDSFKIVAEQRKKLASRIKELQPQVSNRSLANAAPAPCGDQEPLGLISA